MIIKSLFLVYLFINIPIFTSFVYYSRFSSKISRCNAVSDSQDILTASEALYNWIRAESLSSIVSLDNLAFVLEEARSNEVFVQKLQVEFDYVWAKLSTAIDEEERTLREILGEKFTTKLLQFVESLNIYEPATVKAFLSTPVFESMLGGILYEGIFEFLQKVDIIGNVINKLPILGAIRQAVVKEVKSNLDKTLGVQIKGFLSSFNKIAVQRMVEFVLSPQNQKALEKANANLVSILLSKRLKDLFATKGEENRKLKQFIWSFLLTTPIEDVKRIISIVYEKIGDRPFSGLLRLEFSDFMQASPSGEQVLISAVGRFLHSAEGAKFKNSLKIT